MGRKEKIKRTQELVDGFTKTKADKLKAKKIAQNLWIMINMQRIWTLMCRKCRSITINRVRNGLQAERSVLCDSCKFFWDRETGKIVEKGKKVKI